MAEEPPSYIKDEDGKMVRNPEWVAWKQGKGEVAEATEAVGVATLEEDGEPKKFMDSIKDTVGDKKFLSGAGVGFVAGAATGALATHMVHENKKKKKDKKKKKKKKKKKGGRGRSDDDSYESGSCYSDDNYRGSRRRDRRKSSRSVATRSTAEMTDVRSRSSRDSYNGGSHGNSRNSRRSLMGPNGIRYGEYDFHSLGSRGNNSLDLFEDEQFLISAERAAKLANFENRVKTKTLSSLKDAHKETNALLKKAKLKAKSIRKRAVNEIEQTEKEKKAMSKSMRKLKREKEAMAGRIAEMEQQSQFGRQSLQEQQEQEQQQMMGPNDNQEQDLMLLQQQQESMADMLMNLHDEKEFVDQQIAQMEASQSTFGLEELLHQQQNLVQQIYSLEQQQQQLLQTNHYQDSEQMFLLEQQQQQQQQPQDAFGPESFGLMNISDMNMEDLLLMQQQQQQDQQQYGSVYGIDQSRFGNGIEMGQHQEQNPDMNLINTDCNKNNGESTYNDLVTIGQQQFGQNSTVTGGMTIPPPVRVIDPSYGGEDDLSSVEGSFYNNAFHSASKSRSSSHRRSESSSTRKSRASNQSRNSRSASRSRNSRSTRSRSSGGGMDPGGLKRSHKSSNNSSRSGHQRSASSSSIDYTGSVNSRNRQRSSPRHRHRR
mmetsp:Transcript_20507/g.56907  ORF Transcript_20507/g.56907 Transcript_20507/m.56907 type:complete len:654 (+) Transcript_20507:184-2145(+)